MRNNPFDDHTTLELLRMILGERLGGGIDREVYAMAGDPSRVVKVSIGQYDFQNIAEWSLWLASSDKMQQYLAPCYGISPDGKVLIQARCEPCPSTLMPEKFPEFLVKDLHRENLGIFEGRVVCLDYGRHTAAAMSRNAQRMVPVEKLESTEERRGW